MYKLGPSRKSTGIRAIAPVACILVIYIGVTMVEQNEIVAQDKSTSITCTSDGPCEKTECINGECKTTATNSSNISSTTGFEGTEKEVEEKEEKPTNDRNSLADSLRERLDIREK